MRHPARPARTTTLAAALLVGATAASMLTAPVADAAARPAGKGSALDLGVPGLRQTQSLTSLGRGVTLTRIVRGQRAATPPTRGTTPLGPWRITVAMIDPKVARGNLRTAIGADIARTEGVSTLAKGTRSLVAVNGSFFSQGRREAAGDMVGLAVYEGTIISQPQRVAGHQAVLMDSRTKKLTFGDVTWNASLTSDVGALPVSAINSPPAVPTGCADPANPGACVTPGTVVRFTPHYAARTPSGPGAEVVLGRDGCVVAANPVRGTRITAAQTTIQATGTTAAELLRIAGTGCPRYDETLRDAQGAPIPLKPTTFGVTGRYRLVADGTVVAPTYTSSFFQRQPRTFIGRTSRGLVKLVTVDGRSTASVGVTIAEEARLARSLGLVDAVNLDGGGSTAMAVRGALVTTPVGGKERSVGDAIVLMP